MTQLTPREGWGKAVVGLWLNPSLSAIPPDERPSTRKPDPGLVPMSLTAGGRGQVEGGKTVSRSTRSTFNLPPSTEAKRWHEVPPADRVREVGD